MAGEAVAVTTVAQPGQAPRTPDAGPATDVPTVPVGATEATAPAVATISARRRAQETAILLIIADVL